MREIWIIFGPSLWVRELVVCQIFHLWEYSSAFSSWLLVISTLLNFPQSVQQIFTSSACKTPWTLIWYLHTDSFSWRKAVVIWGFDFYLSNQYFKVCLHEPSCIFLLIGGWCCVSKDSSHVSLWLEPQLSCLHILSRSVSRRISVRDTATHSKVVCCWLVILCCLLIDCRNLVQHDDVSKLVKRLLSAFLTSLSLSLTQSSSIWEVLKSWMFWANCLSTVLTWHVRMILSRHLC